MLSVGQGFDLGYRGYMVSDATAAFSERLQQATEEIVSGYMARVVTTDEMIGLLPSGAVGSAISEPVSG